MRILFLIYPIYIHRHYHHSHAYILELMTRSQQRPSWLSWQSVALDSWGREFDSHRRPLWVAFFATSLGWVLENLHTRKTSLSFTLTKNHICCKLVLLVSIESVLCTLPNTYDLCQNHLHSIYGFYALTMEYITWKLIFILYLWYGLLLLSILLFFFIRFCIIYRCGRRRRNQWITTRLKQMQRGLKKISKW